MTYFNNLPLEVVLRILEFCSLADLANLTRLSRSWHDFIDGSRQEIIYQSRVDRPPGASDLSFLEDSATFERYYEGIATFKKLCRRQTLLLRNWNSSRPLTKEFLYRIVGYDKALSLWHLDLKRRFIISFSTGDKPSLELNERLNVTDIDTQELLWSDAIRCTRYCKKFKYRDGIAVFPPIVNDGSLLEVWKTDNSQARGVFRKFGDLVHDCDVDGIDLGPDHVCTVSRDGWGFVWDVNGELPQLVTRMSIKQSEPWGLSQDEDVVMYSMYEKGYHILDKTTGALLGEINPGKCQRSYAIDAPELDTAATMTAKYTRAEYNGMMFFPPGKATSDRSTPLKLKGPVWTDDWTESEIESGERTDGYGPQHECTTGILSGSLMVGLCGGEEDGPDRLIIYPDWKKGFSTPGHFEDNAYIIRLGGAYQRIDCSRQVSVHGNRIMLRAQQCIYIISLNEDGTAPEEGQELPIGPSFCFYAGYWSTWVGQMQLFDDCAAMDYWVCTTALALSHFIRPIHTDCYSRCRSKASKKSLTFGPLPSLILPIGCQI